MSILENLTEKKKQKLRMWSMLGGLVLLVVILSSLFDDGDRTDRMQDHEARKKGKFSLLTEKVEKESWIAAQGTNIKKLQIENEEFRRELQSMKDRMGNMQEKQKDMEITARNAISAHSQGKLKNKIAKSDAVPPLPKVKDDRDRDRENRLEREVKRSRKDLPGVQSEPSIKVYTDSSTEEEDSPEAKKKKEESVPSIVLSSGSFMKVVMLNGIDAPTDFGSKSEPYPVLMNIVDTTVLPNLYRMNLKNCFIIGAGYGNLADERAYIRTEKISCITASNRVIDTDLKGHAVGEDGKLGIRGKLISKQGQLIAQSLLSGSLGGLAKAFKPQQSVAINLGPNGNNSTVTPEIEDVFRAGGAEGVSTAMNKVAEFYLKMAEKIFPIIEIDAGRKVDILVLEQSDLKPGDAVSGG